MAADSLSGYQFTSNYRRQNSVVDFLTAVEEFVHTSDEMDYLLQLALLDPRAAAVAPGLRNSQLVYTPVALAGVALVVLLPGLGDGRLTVSQKTLFHILIGDIEYWDDHAIADTNPAIDLPHLPITFAVIDDHDAGGCL